MYADLRIIIPSNGFGVQNVHKVQTVQNVLDKNASGVISELDNLTTRIQNMFTVNNDSDENLSFSMPTPGMKSCA